MAVDTLETATTWNRVPAVYDGVRRAIDGALDRHPYAEREIARGFMDADSTGAGAA